MNSERETKDSPFTMLPQTRWLVRGKVMSNILVKDELKAYFLCCKDVGTQDVRYKARQLCEMLCDEVNKCYFHFAVPIIQGFERVNAFFQSENADPDKVVTELQTFYRSLRNRLYTHEGAQKPLNLIEFGAKFSLEIQKLEAEKQDYVKT